MKLDHFSSNVRRGDIYYADLSPVVGSEQGGMRPVLIVQNNVGNRFSPTVIAAAITSQLNKAKLPTHIEIEARTYGLSKDSVILLEQVRTLDKRRLREKMGRLDEQVMGQVDDAIAVSFGLRSGGQESTQPVSYTHLQMKPIAHYTQFWGKCKGEDRRKSWHPKKKDRLFL